MSTETLFTAHDLYKSYFGNSPYYVPEKSKQTATAQDGAFSGIAKNPKPANGIYYSKNNIAFNKIGAYGQAIWFPVTFKKSNQVAIEIEACTIAVNLSSTLIETPVSERVGAVIEKFHEDNYKFSIKGVLIGKNRTFPEDQIKILTDLKQTLNPVSLHGGYPELFLDESCQIAIGELDFPEVQGKAPWARPFMMSCKSDFIRDLIVK